MLSTLHLETISETSETLNSVPEKQNVENNDDPFATKHSYDDICKICNFYHVNEYEPQCESETSVTDIPKGNSSLPLMKLLHEDNQIFFAHLQDAYNAYFPGKHIEHFNAAIDNAAVDAKEISLVAIAQALKIDSTFDLYYNKLIPEMKKNSELFKTNDAYSLNILAFPCPKMCKHAVPPQKFLDCFENIAHLTPRFKLCYFFPELILSTMTKCPETLTNSLSMIILEMGTVIYDNVHTYHRDGLATFTTISSLEEDFSIATFLSFLSCINTKSFHSNIITLLGKLDFTQFLLNSIGHSGFDKNHFSHVILITTLDLLRSLIFCRNHYFTVRDHIRNYLTHCPVVKHFLSLNPIWDMQDIFLNDKLTFVNFLHALIMTCMKETILRTSGFSYYKNIATQVVTETNKLENQTTV